MLTRPYTVWVKALDQTIAQVLERFSTSLSPKFPKKLLTAAEKMEEYF
jgi:hypothetical protein